MESRPGKIVWSSHEWPVMAVGPLSRHDRVVQLLRKARPLSNTERRDTLRKKYFITERATCGRCLCNAGLGSNSQEEEEGGENAEAVQCGAPMLHLCGRFGQVWRASHIVLRYAAYQI